MISIKAMNSGEKKQLQSLLFERFGSSINGEFMINNQNKVFLVTPKIRLINLKDLNADGVGLYVCCIERDGVRLSIEGSQLLKAVNNTIEISDEQVFDWTRGFKLDIKASKGYVIIKHKGDVLGCGKSNGEVIFNDVPKPRRIRKL